MEIPKANLPKALEIPQMYLKQPSAYVPSYKPIVIPPSDLEAPPETKAEETTTEQPEPPKLQIPVLDIQMPLPEPAVVVTAVTTAVVAVGATSVTQTLFEPIKKKVQKQLQKQVDKWKEKRKNKKDSSKSLKTE